MLLNNRHILTSMGAKDKIHFLKLETNISLYQIIYEKNSNYVIIYSFLLKFKHGILKTIIHIFTNQYNGMGE